MVVEFSLSFMSFLGTTLLLVFISKLLYDVRVLMKKIHLTLLYSLPTKPGQERGEDWGHQSKQK